MHVTITIFAGIIGLIVGSFLNVVILRLHAGKAFIKGRSACPHCKHVLGPLELVPVLSWLALGGRCKHCHKAISVQYPLVELATAILFAVASLTHPFNTGADLLELVFWLYIIGSLIVLTVYDLRWYLLPDKVLLPLIIPAVAMLIAQALIAHSFSAIMYPIAAAVLFGGAFYLLAAVSKGRWMGGGDIKLAFVMGLLLGLQRTALALFIAFDTAAIVGVVLIAIHRKKRSDLIPFGPFLVLGTLAAYYWGTPILHWYLQVSGLALPN